MDVCVFIFFGLLALYSLISYIVLSIREKRDKEDFENDSWKYDDEEEDSKETINEIRQKYGLPPIKNYKNSGRYPGVKNIDLSKQKENEES